MHLEPLVLHLSPVSVRAASVCRWKLTEGQFNLKRDNMVISIQSDHTSTWTEPVCFCFVYKYKWPSKNIQHLEIIFIVFFIVATTTTCRATTSPSASVCCRQLLHTLTLMIVSSSSVLLLSSSLSVLWEVNLYSPVKPVEPYCDLNWTEYVPAESWRFSLLSTDSGSMCLCCLLLVWTKPQKPPNKFLIHLKTSYMYTCLEDKTT